MSFCWLFIVGIIAATVYSININYVNIVYGASALFILLGIVLHIIQKKNLTIADSTVMTFFLIGSFLLGYARYTHEHNFSDPNHISQFAQDGYDKNAPTFQIIGKISSDPDVYYDKTKITIEPYLIKKMKIENKYKKVAGGEITVQVNRKMRKGNSIDPIWTEFSVPESYGKIVKVTGKLVAPRPKSDPFGYDAREQAYATNVYALMYNPERMTAIDETFEMDEQEKQAYNDNREKYNPLYMLTKFSLSVKRKFLTTIKRTMPYPESAFLSGITLGLKRGLQNMPTIHNEYYKYYNESLLKDDAKILEDYVAQYDPSQDKNRQLITVQFQWSGVGHVLAVSGLHVTIITIFLFGIFSAMKIHRKVFAPMLVLGLIIFCIITGAAPSSTRATLMNSIAVLTLVYSARGLRASAIFSIGAAGFLILLKSPLVIYSPSFSLSFGAVLALVLLTKPVDMQLIKLRGLPFIWGILIFIGFFFIVRYDWFLFVNPFFYIPAVVAIILIGIVLKKLDEQYPVASRFGYQSIPNTFRQFLSAQFAIQIGMMIPFSAWYFTKFPVAGMLANFIAIPLVGINVQLGIFSGILGMIPKIGIWVALVLNATNWVLCKFFLWSADFFCRIIPYPNITMWTLGRFVFYFVLVAIFIWWNAFKKKKEELYYRLRIPTMGPAGDKVKLFEKIFAVVFILVMIYLTAHKTPDGIKITTLDVGYAESNIVQLKSGKTIVINGSVREFNDANPFAEFDQGDRVVYNYIKRQGIITVDAVIAQSLSPEYLTGLYFLAANSDLKAWYDMIDHKQVNSKTSPEDFFNILGLKDFAANSGEKYPKLIYDKYMEILKVLEKRKIPAYKIKEGDVLFKEKINGADFYILCLNPPENPADNYTLLDNSLVLKAQFGEKSVLMGGSILEAALENIAGVSDKSLVKADVLILPHHGVPLLDGWEKDKDDDAVRRISDYNNKLTDLVQPEYVIASFTRPRINFFNKKASFKFRDMTKESLDKFYKSKFDNKFFRTDVDKTVIIESKDGKTLKITTMVEILKKQKAKTDALKNRGDSGSDDSEEAEDQSDKNENAADNL